MTFCNSVLISHEMWRNDDKCCLKHADGKETSSGSWIPSKALLTFAIYQDPRDLEDLMVLTCFTQVLTCFHPQCLSVFFDMLDRCQKICFCSLMVVHYSCASSPLGLDQKGPQKFSIVLRCS